MHAAQPASVDLYWIPLGAGGHCVRFSGKAFEALAAACARRARCDLYHAALIVSLDGARYTVELAPAWGGSRPDRGVVGSGPVGSRLLARWRLFRYELRCWRGGTIPDLSYAVGGRQSLTTDPVVARRLLASAATVPTPVWGRDELRAGEMWNSNSVIAWLLTRAGIPSASITPPTGGRAPGWDSGVTVAMRLAPYVPQDASRRRSSASRMRSRP